jgi:hypothetical protein
MMYRQVPAFYSQIERVPRAVIRGEDFESDSL